MKSARDLLTFKSTQSVQESQYRWVNLGLFEFCIMYVYSVVCMKRNIKYGLL